MLFVFWYCHKRGRETRLEKEKLATEETGSAPASSASSFDDGDSIFTPKSKGQSSKVTQDKAEPPLIIGDNKDSTNDQSATVNDLPSVQHLPDPNTAARAQGDNVLKEEALKLPESK